MSSIEHQYAPLGEVGDLSPDSSFLALAREFMDHVEFTQELRDTTRHENRRLIETKIAPHMGALNTSKRPQRRTGGAFMKTSAVHANTATADCKPSIRGELEASGGAIRTTPRSSHH